MTLSWNLISTTPYEAEEELECTLTMTAPVDGNYYLVGALYDSSGNYLSGTIFGVLLAAGATYAVNNPTLASLWALTSGSVQVIPCKLIFDRTNVTLGIFMMDMVGTETSWEDDTEVGSVSTALAGAVPAEPIDIGSLLSLMVVVMMMSMMMKTVVGVTEPKPKLPPGYIPVKGR